MIGRETTIAKFRGPARLCGGKKPDPHSQSADARDDPCTGGSRDAWARTACYTPAVSEATRQDAWSKG